MNYLETTRCALRNVTRRSYRSCTHALNVKKLHVNQSISEILHIFFPDKFKMGVSLRHNWAKGGGMSETHSGLSKLWRCLRHFLIIPSQARRETVRNLLGVRGWCFARSGFGMVKTYSAYLSVVLPMSISRWRRNNSIDLRSNSTSPWKSFCE